MRVVLGEVLTLALVVTLSPLNIIPAIVLLFSKRPLAGALSFLVGFVVGVAAVLGTLVVIAHAVDLSLSGDHSTLVSILKLALGVYLLGAGVRKFRGRQKVDQDESMPEWMDEIGGYTPLKSLGAGAVLGAVNPKNIVVSLAAAVTIAAADLSIAQQVGACAIYVLVAILGVATPILVMLFLGERAPAVLQGWRSWLGRNSAAVMSVLFLVLGVVLFGQAVAGG